MVKRTLDLIIGEFIKGHGIIIDQGLINDNCLETIPKTTSTLLSSTSSNNHPFVGGSH